ncbi:MAG: hypothetical protein ACRELV_08360 [Longimicrobiales bacterium]
MLANDQIKELARRLGDEARQRIELRRVRSDASADDGGERETLWEAAARASNVIAEIARLDGDDELEEPERGRRAGYLESELEIALDAVKSARRSLKWRARPIE